MVVYDDAMIRALEAVKDACINNKGCDGCPCLRVGGCGMNYGFKKYPDSWQLEKTYKEVITDIKF